MEEVDLKLGGWIQALKEAEPEMASLSDQQIRTLALKFFAALRARIDEVDQGFVKVVGFGRFRIAQVEPKDGSDAPPGKRVMFILNNTGGRWGQEK